MSLMSVTSIDTVRFRTTSLLEVGYHRGEVDRYLEQLRHDVGRQTPQTTVVDLRYVTFSAVRLRRGYDMHQVDAFLEEIVRHLQERRRG